MSPSLQKYIQNRLFISQRAGQEFVTRMNAPCDNRDPMTGDLKMELYRIIRDDKVALEFVSIIENYFSIDIPRLTSDVKAALKRVIYPEFYLEFIRLFDQTCVLPVYRLYSTTATEGQTITVPGQGDQPVFGFPFGLSGWMQYVSGQVSYGGGGDLTGASGWAVCETEPVGWLLDAAPVVWQDNGIVTLLPCQSVSILVDTNTYSLRYLVGPGFQVEIEPVSFIAYNDGTFDTQFQTGILTAFGQSVTSSVTITPGRVDLIVRDTYIPSIGFGSSDFINPTQYDTAVACP